MKLIIFLMSNFFLCIHFTPVNAQNPLNVKIIGIGNISRSEMKMISEGIADYYSFTFTWQKEIGYKIDTAYLDEDIILTKPFLDSLEENYACDSDKILFVTNEKITISRIPFYDLRHLIRGYASAVGGNFAIVSTYKLNLNYVIGIVMRV